MADKRTRKSTAARQHIKPKPNVGHAMNPLQMRIFQGQWEWANDPSSVFPWMRKDNGGGRSE